MSTSIAQLKKQLESGFFGFWVKNWRVSFLVIGLIIFLGLFSLFTMPKESSPKIDFGIIQISTVYLGANPVDMDTLVTQEIEDAIDDIDAIKSIDSQSRQSVATTTVELFNEANTQDVLIEIKDEVDKINLPSEAEDPVVTELSTDSEVMFELVVYWAPALFPPERLKELARSIKWQLEGKYNITSIDIQWWAEYDLHVLVDKQKLEQIGLTIGQVNTIVRSFNQNQPLGRYQVDGLSYDFRIEWEIHDTQELLAIPLVTPQTSQLKLGDISTLTRDYDDEAVRKAGVYQDGWYNSVTLTFNKKEGSNIFTSSSDAKGAIEKLFQTAEFDQAQFIYSSDLSEVIREDYQILAKSWLQTLFFVFLCLLIFVWVKEAGIATAAIPMAFLVTFVVIDQLWLSLNFLTNFSLVLTLGIAIDTTIVIIEAAYEKLKLGFAPKTAILMAVRDFKRPLIAGTSTTIVVFIPLMVLPGVTWKFLAYIPITVFSTLVAALFISLTINSALFYKLSRKKDNYIVSPSTEKFLTPEDKAILEEERADKTWKHTNSLSKRERLLDNLNERYERILRSFISKKSNRNLSIILPVILLILTFLTLSPRIWFTLFPAGDNERFDMEITTKVGNTTEQTLTRLPYIEPTLTDLPELKHYNINAQDNKIQIAVELTDKDLRAQQWLRDVFETEQAVLEKLSFLRQEWLKVESVIQAGGPPQDKPVAIKLTAERNEQFGTLLTVAKEFETHLRSIEGTKNVAISSPDTPGQFVYSFDKEKLNTLWLTPSDLMREINAILNWFTAGSITINDQDVDIKILYDQFAQQLSPKDIQDLIITTSAGPVRVGELIDYQIDNAVAQISREDTNITVRVQSDLDEAFANQGRTIQAQLMEFARWYEFPTDISYTAGGEWQENADLINATLRWLVIALFLIFVILVLQFNSYSQPVIIIYSVILALLGVNIWLFATWNPYSMPFAIWFIALMGIVVNDAIIMIDRINENISHKIDVFESIIEGARSRLQPIILTTLTTLLGVLPISLQDKFREWLWFTMIFGLFAGSAMTLFVIPSLYYMVFVKKQPKA